MRENTLGSPRKPVLGELPLWRWPWLLLAASALGLELCALYFQYVLELDPCVLCVYERTAVGGILLAGLIGAIAPRLALFRWTGFVLWLVAAGWGLQLAMQHVGIQIGEIDQTCTYLADFPSWAPLDQWWPAVFQPTGMCDDIQWLFLGLSMPQWMMGVYSIYLLVWVVVVIGRLMGKGRVRNTDLG